MGRGRSFQPPIEIQRVIYEFTTFNALHFYEKLITKTVHLQAQAKNLLKTVACSGHALLFHVSFCRYAERI